LYFIIDYAIKAMKSKPVLITAAAVKLPPRGCTAVAYTDSVSLTQVLYRITAFAVDSVFPIPVS
jgi:hypothetical protein